MHLCHLRPVFCSFPSWVSLEPAVRVTVAADCCKILCLLIWQATFLIHIYRLNKLKMSPSMLWLSSFLLKDTLIDHLYHPIKLNLFWGFILLPSNSFGVLLQGHLSSLSVIQNKQAVLSLCSPKIGAGLPAWHICILISYGEFIMGNVATQPRMRSLEPFAKQHFKRARQKEWFLF